MTEQEKPDVLSRTREYTLDWLVALLPLWLISLFYFRLSAFVLELLALGGYLMAALLLERLVGGRSGSLLLRGAVTALLVAFCLPAKAPFWLSALGGGLAAMLDILPRFLQEKFSRLTLPRVHPALTAFVVLRLVFPTGCTGYTMPTQWIGIDSLSAATPLAAFFGQPLLIERWHLFFGVHAGTIGGVCTAVTLLAAVYLLLRRRIRVLTPAAMLVTVSLLSLCLWQSPLYALLAGGVCLTAVVLGDKTYAPKAPLDQLMMGLVAGVVTVLIRRFGGWAEGAAVGLLAAQMLLPFFPCFYRLCRFLWDKAKGIYINLRNSKNNG